MSSRSLSWIAKRGSQLGHHLGEDASCPAAPAAVQVEYIKEGGHGRRDHSFSICCHSIVLSNDQI